MGFTISGLDPTMFGALYGQKQATFNGLPAQLHDVTTSPGSPCRITLDDAEVGDQVWLISHQHQMADSPYAQSGPIFISNGAAQAAHYEDEIPPALSRRLLSLRGFDDAGMMIDAIVVEGSHAKAEIERIFANPLVTKIDAHNAMRGCFAAHILPKR